MMASIAAVTAVTAVTAGTWASTASVAAGTTAMVFAVAALAKIRHPATAELRRFGLPAPRAVAVALPIAELAIAALIVARPRHGTAVALVALATFTVVVARAVSQGRDVSCGCFGSRSPKPVSWATVGRNLVLLAVAGPALLAPSWSRPDTAAVATVVGVALIGALAVHVTELWLAMGRLWSVELAGEVRRSSMRRSQP